MHHPTYRIAHTTTFATPVVEHWFEREIVQWVHPMKGHRTMSERSYHGATSRSYFSLMPVLHDWCNKYSGMRCPVGGMMHIKESLLIIGKSSPCVLYHISDAI